MKRLIGGVAAHAKNAHSHLKKHHKHYMIGGFGVYSITKMLLLLIPMMIGLYVGLCNPDANAKMWESNDQFLDGTGFWSQLTLPDNGAIVNALYGHAKTKDHTAYTLPWGDDYAWTCLEGEGMQVVYLEPGLDEIPQILNTKTVYVLNHGDYHISYADGIVMPECSAIVGNGDVSIYSNSQIEKAGMINNFGYKYTILDNIKINGAWSLEGKPHSNNMYGIYMRGGDGPTDTTINRVQGAYNDTAISFDNFNNATVVNSQFFNNTNGITTERGEKINLYNDKVFNNDHGISILRTFGVAINNNQLYNNGRAGLLISTIKLHTIITKTSIYNNGLGLNITGAPIYIFDSRIYNNKIGFTFTSSKGSKYYNKLKIFSNDKIFDGTNGSDYVFTGGKILDDAVKNISTEDGYIDNFGCMSCARYSNPQNSDELFMMDTSKSKNCETRGVLERADTKVVSYLYGYRIPTQSQGYILSSSKIEDAITDYDPLEFIAQDDILGEYTGDLACNFHDCKFDGKKILHGSGVTTYQSGGILPYTGTCISEYRICNDGYLSGTYEFPNCNIAEPLDCSFSGELVLHGSGVIAYSSTGVEFGTSCISEIRTCENGNLDGTYLYSGCIVGEPSDCDFNGETVSHLAGVEAFFSTGVEFGSSCVSEIRVCYDGDLNGTAPYDVCEPADPANCTLSGETILHGSGIELYFSTGVAYGSSCVAETRVCYDGELNGTATYSGCEAALPANCYINGTSVLDGESITLWEASNVACGHTCESQSRTCDNGEFDGSYTNSSCSVSSCGGGGNRLRKDDCPNGDNSSSYYDRDCGEEEDDDDDNNDDEEDESHTSSPISPTTIPREKTETKLNRYLAAQMIIDNAALLGLEYQDRAECYQFSDVSREQQEYVTKICNAGVMGLTQDRITVAKEFNPLAEVTRAQSLVLLTSILRGSDYGIRSYDDVMKPFYWAIPSAEFLYKNNIVQHIGIDWLARVELKIYFQKMIDRVLIFKNGGGSDIDNNNANDSTHGSAYIIEYLRPSTKTSNVEKQIDNNISETEDALNSLLESIRPEDSDPKFRLNKLFEK